MSDLPPLGRNLLVQFFPECIPSARNEVFGLVSRMVGVARVVDLGAITEDTLRLMLLPTERGKPRLPDPSEGIKTGHRRRVIAEQRAEIRKDEPTMVGDLPVVSKKRSLRERMGE